MEVIRIGDVVENALKNFKDEGIDVHLFDASANKENRFLHFRPSQLPEMSSRPGKEEEIQKNMNWSETFDLADRQWKIVFSPSSFYLASQKIWQPWLILLGALSLTSLLANYLAKRLTYTADIERRVQKQMQTNLELEKEITQRKKIEETLRHSEEKYRTLVENIDLGVALIDSSYKVVTANTAIADLFEKKAMSFIGEKCFQGFKTKKMVCANCPGTIAMATGQPHETEHEQERSDGSPATYKIWAFPVIEQDGKATGFIEVVEDITERLKTEENKQRSQQLESIGLLAGGIAHDFNNLLTVILGNIDLAQIYLSPAEKPHEFLENSKRASGQAQKLTQQLLTFARGGAPIKQTFELDALIKDVVSFSLSGSNTKCDYQFADNLWAVEADKGQINQVFHNVLLNADQAMPEGGTIRISGENINIEPDHPLPMTAGKYVKVSVTDQGVGLPAKHLSKIFDPYFTTKQLGNGMGLAICYSIINKHGGFINAESEPGEGMTISIFLPASQKVPLDDSTQKSEPIKGSGKVLVMDDEEQVRNVASSMLEHLGYEGHFAKNGKEAIEIFREAKTKGQPFDVVILDLTIPGGMGGKDTIQKLLEIEPEIKAIVSSGYSNDPVMADFQAHGFSGVAEKPYKVHDLSRVLHSVLHG